MPRRRDRRARHRACPPQPALSVPGATATPRRCRGLVRPARHTAAGRDRRPGLEDSDVDLCPRASRRCGMKIRAGEPGGLRQDDRPGRGRTYRVDGQASTGDLRRCPRNRQRHGRPRNRPRHALGDTDTPLARGLTARAWSAPQAERVSLEDEAANTLPCTDPVHRPTASRTSEPALERLPRRGLPWTRPWNLTHQARSWAGDERGRPRCC
jgi:hypothetical protein